MSTPVALEKQKATYRFETAFHDGTSNVFESPRLGNDPARFADAVNDG